MCNIRRLSIAPSPCTQGHTIASEHRLTILHKDDRSKLCAIERTRERMSVFTFTTMCALDFFLVGVSTSFSGHVFLDTSLGVWYTHIGSFRYSYTLNLIFSVLYIHWGQCMIQVWGYGRHIYTHLSRF